jgi:peroxiredoxin
MRMNMRLLSMAALTCGALFSSTGAFAIKSGDTAPSFELQTIAGDRYIRSHDLFSTFRYTFIVFWRSSCPHCVEALLGCDRFFRSYGSEDVTVLGINTGEGDPLGTTGLIESNGITFPQARDAGGLVATSYDIPSGTVTVCLVGVGARVIDVRVDPKDDAGTVMERMLMSSPETSDQGEQMPPSPPGASAQDERQHEIAGVSYEGLERMRLLSIDSRGSAATGLYGEPVSSGNTFQYRLQVVASKRLMRHLRVGGLLRVSNEGTRVLDSGPQYLGSEWGSAFAEIEARRLRVRLGFYEISMTPLTLMRWDWDDNPRVGGDAGCGCGATAGTLLVESLEELGPKLTFEGALVSYGTSSFEARLFYAIPRRARETGYAAYRSGAGERARYSLELYGFEGRWQRFDARTGAFWKVGLHALGSFEDSRSVDFGALGYLAADSWTSTRIASVSGEAPLVRFARLRGELVVWNDATEHGVVTTVGPRDFSREGAGGLGGIVLEPSTRIGLTFDYLRLDPDFFTPFAALSYEPNTEGPRVSGRAVLLREFATLSFFHKRLREADVEGDAERERILFSGASLDVRFLGSCGAGVGWLEKKSKRGGEVSPFDAYRRAIMASLEYHFEKAGVLQFQFQKTKSVDTNLDERTDSRGNLYALYSTIYF